jgi:hypothetical protein
VALPEEMPVNETLELHAALKERVKVRTHAAVLNASVPERFSEADLAGLAHSPALLALARAHHDRSASSVLSHLKLERNLNVPVHLVPRLFVPRFGREAVERVGSHLAALVSGRTS